MITVDEMLDLFEAGWECTVTTFADANRMWLERGDEFRVYDSPDGINWRLIITSP